MRLWMHPLLIVAVLLAATIDVATQTAASVRINISTNLGEMEVELDTAQAPATVANFLRYVDADHYNGGQFHRTVTMNNQPNNDVKIEVIQASVNPARSDDGFGPITLERTTVTGLRHLNGAISMARGAPDSATSSFFFCIGDQPSLLFASMLALGGATAWSSRM